MQKLVQGIHQFQDHLFSSQRERFERLADGQHPETWRPSHRDRTQRWARWGGEAVGNKWPTCLIRDDSNQGESFESPAQ